MDNILFIILGIYIIINKYNCLFILKKPLDIPAISTKISHKLINIIVYLSNKIKYMYFVSYLIEELSNIIFGFVNHLNQNYYNELDQKF